MFPISVYVMGCVLEWIKHQGGIMKMYENSLIKSKVIYDVINKSNGFYVNTIDTIYRSRMNIPFSIGSEQMEGEFLRQAAEQYNMIQLAGHFSVGGIRASLYNAVSCENATKLAEYMQQFLDLHRKK